MATPGAFLERRLWPELGIIDQYSSKVGFRDSPSGQRRVSEDPPEDVVKAAFDQLGTHKAVAAAFGVARHVVTRWIPLCEMHVISRPEVRHSNFIRRTLELPEDKVQIAQWVTDEGYVGATHSQRSDLTSLLVGGSMNDHRLTAHISRILATPFGCSRAGGQILCP